LDPLAMVVNVLQLLRRVASSVKFKIVAAGVVTAVAATAVTTHFVLSTTQSRSRQQLLLQSANDVERTANLLSSKLELLQTALQGVASQVRPEMLRDRPGLTQFLVDKPSAGMLFDTVFILAPNGDLLVRLEKGVPGTQFPNLGDREYFQRVMREKLPVVSRPLVSAISHAAVLIFAVPVRQVDGQITAVVGGALRLDKTGLLSFLRDSSGRDNSRDLVIDRSGQILAHADPKRIMGHARDEAGLSAEFERWALDGSTIHVEGAASVGNGYLVALAGVPAAEWMLIHVTPEADAMQSLAAARDTAWRVGAIVGLAAALLAGLLAWFITRPISQLHARAMSLLDDEAALRGDWPRGEGEIGALSRAFQHVVEQRMLRGRETHRLLVQLQAVLDAAHAGIALTREGRFELVSRHFCELFGRDKAELLGHDTRLIFTSDLQHQQLSQQSLEALDADGAYEAESPLARRDGSTFRGHIRGSLLPGSDRRAGIIWIVEDVTEAHERNARLSWSATHDAMTRLANRVQFDQVLDEATQRAGEQPFCALFIDLDRFKAVNDTAGHAAGDALLRDIAAQLQERVRPSDTVARLGGDEFAVLLPHCPVKRALAIADSLRAAINGHRLEWEGHSLGVGASIGLVQVDASFANAAAVLKAADMACYAAKRDGRNQVVVYTTAMAASRNLVGV
jgi:diguanylate cyclase (GGDEF)-like protein/PAS domain S-box-containing protein